MTDQQLHMVADLLRAEKAHAEYESKTGVRDDNWAAYYANFLVSQGWRHSVKGPSLERDAERNLHLEHRREDDCKFEGYCP